MNNSENRLLMLSAIISLLSSILGIVAIVLKLRAKKEPIHRRFQSDTGLRRGR